MNEIDLNFENYSSYNLQIAFSNNLCEMIP